MKITNYLRWLCLVCMVCILIYTAGELFQHQNTSEEKYQFTFICPLQWNGMAKGIIDAGEDYSAYTKMVGFHELSAEKMEEAFEEAIYSGTDGIITAGVPDFENINDAVQRAAEHDIPVIIVDSDMPSANRICYIGIDDYEAGKTAGQDLIKITDGNAKIGIMTSSMDMQNQQERVQGFLDQMKEYPYMDIVEIAEGYSERLFILEELNQMLEDHPDLTALFLAEGWAANVVGDWMESKGKTDLTVVSFDGINAGDYLERSIYDAVIQSDIYNIGYLALKKLVIYLEGQEIESTINIDIVNVTADNPQDYLDIKQSEMEEILWYFY